MNLTNQFDPIRKWALEKGILDNGDAKTQTVKLAEELGELAQAVLKKNTEDTWDAIGDMVVVLTSIAFFSGATIEQCINGAYREIKNRQGKMTNGNFVKNEEPG